MGMSAQHFQSHGLSRKKCRLPMWPVQCFKMSRMGATQSPEPGSEVTVSLMLHSVSQSKSQSQSRLKRVGKWSLSLDRSSRITLLRDMHTGRLDSLGTNIKCASQVVLVVKNPPASSGCCKRHRFDPWVWKMSGGRQGNSLQYSCLEGPMDRGAWQATVHRVAKSQT